jgi:hypothetical protein
LEPDDWQKKDTLFDKSIDTIRRRSRFRLLLLLNLPLLIVLGCALPQEPGDWSWDTHLYLPLGARTYGMWDLADPVDTLRSRGSGIGSNADSSLFFLGYQNLDVSFRDSLYLDSSLYEAMKPLTAILVPVNLDQTDVFSLGTLNPDVAAQDGDTLLYLPPHSLTASTVISLGDRVENMTVDTGSVLLTVANTLSYAVTNLQIRLNNQVGQEYSLITDAAISSGGQFSQWVSLQNFELVSSATLELSATGEGGDSILVDSTLGLSLSARIDTLQAEPYTGIIPPQELRADSTVDFYQQHRLYLGIIDTGSVTITAINQTQLDDTVWVIFPSLTTQAGDTLISKQFVPAYEERSETINLRNYVMRLTNTTPQRVAVRVRSVSAETPNSDTFQNNGQFVRGMVSTTRIGFSYFEGVVNNLELPFAPQGTSIARPPQGWDSVRPTTVDAFVHVHEGIDATANTLIDVRTFLFGNSIAQDSINAPDVYLGADTTLEYHDLSGLMNQYPDSISTSGMMIISGPVAMYETETISLDVELRAPLEFTLTPVDAPGDVQRVETQGIEDIQGGNANIRIWNRLPVGGRVYLVADPDSLHVLEHSGFVVDTLADVTIPISTIVGGRATGEAYAELMVPFDANVLSLFQHRPFYTRMQISLPGSNGDTLIAHGSDYIRVQVIADLTYRLHTGGGN